MSTLPYAGLTVSSSQKTSRREYSRSEFNEGTLQEILRHQKQQDETIRRNKREHDEEMRGLKEHTEKLKEEFKELFEENQKLQEELAKSAHSRSQLMSVMDIYGGRKLRKNINALIVNDPYLREKVQLLRKNTPQKDLWKLGFAVISSSILPGPLAATIMAAIMKR